MDAPSSPKPSATETHLRNPAYGSSSAFGKAGEEYTLIAQTFTMTLDCEIIEVSMRIFNIRGNGQPIEVSLVRCPDRTFPSDDESDILAATVVPSTLFPGGFPGFCFNWVSIQPSSLRVGAGDTLALVLKSDSPLDGQQMEYLVPEVAGEHFDRGSLLQKIGNDAWRGVGGLRGFTGSGDFSVQIQR